MNLFNIKEVLDYPDYSALIGSMVPGYVDLEAKVNNYYIPDEEVHTSHEFLIKTEG